MRESILREYRTTTKDNHIKAKETIETSIYVSRNGITLVNFNREDTGPIWNQNKNIQQNKRAIFLYTDPVEGLLEVAFELLELLLHHCLELLLEVRGHCEGRSKLTADERIRRRRNKVQLSRASSIIFYRFTLSLFFLLSVLSSDNARSLTVLLKRLLDHVKHSVQVCRSLFLRISETSVQLCTWNKLEKIRKGSNTGQEKKAFKQHL